MFLSTDPKCSISEEAGRETAEKYRQHILYGVKRGVTKVINMARLYGIKQGETEEPGTHYKRIIAVFLQFTARSRKPKGDSRHIYYIYIYYGGAWPDIRSKLQKNADSVVLPVAHLLERAYHIHAQHPEKKEK